MTRPIFRTAAVTAAMTLSLVGSACTGGSEPGPTAETTDPVEFDVHEEQGESLLPENPEDASRGTDG